MSSSIKIGNLTCNYMDNPLGVETLKPRLSWVLKSTERGQRSTAYRILVADSPEKLDSDEGDLWDSGRVESDQSIFIPYSGKTLKSGQKCFWKVCVWDKQGKKSEWSATATWEMGLLNKSDWKAKWIGSPAPESAIRELHPAPLFRKVVALNREVKSARAYICGLGFFELYINGRKVSDEVLSPGFTKYDQTVLYNTYDITDLLNSGEQNVVGVILGNGWYNSFIEDAWDFNHAPWRDNVKFLLQIKISFKDGKESLIVSDDSWLTTAGPIIDNGLRTGEIYDARLEKKGWNQVDNKDDDWEQAVLMKPPGGLLKSQQMTPIKIIKNIKPVGLKETERGTWVYDFGQNFSGWVKIRLKGPTGTKITLKYSERIKEDGSIDTSNIEQHIRSRNFQTDTFIFQGEDVECWEPRFTYHGFRYVQLTGFPGKPTIESITGRVVHTAFEEGGSFSCSKELLNSIQDCARWSSLTNYHGIPTDCPHREKNGWTADAHLSAEQMLFNFNPMTCYSKWLEDFIDVQRPSGQLPGIVPTGGWGFNWGSGPAWDSAVILIPWYLYLYYGDLVILKKLYNSMKLYVDYMTLMSSKYIVDFGLGDWNPPEGGPEDYPCSTALTDTAYYYIDAKLLSEIADLLGKREDSRKYRKLAENIRRAFRENFMDVEIGKLTVNSQTSTACALYQGLVNREEQEDVLVSLIAEVEKNNRHINCGILGTKYILQVLTDCGRADIAYEIATQKTFPGWGYWIEQGATTLWESWQGNQPDSEFTYSENHHMFSDISAWFYKALAGISPDPAHPGFKHIIIKPNIVGDLKWVKANHYCMYGNIVSDWKVIDDMVTYIIRIPVNCTATILLQTKDIESVMESGIPVALCEDIKVLGRDYQRIILEINSGSYYFTAKL